jgi:hypothetical membrane protein
LGRQAARVSIAATIYFVVAAVAAHVLSTQYNFFRDYISDYAIGPWGWIYGSAYWASAIGCLALAIALKQSVPANALSRTGAALLILVGVSYLVTFLYPTEILAPGAPPVTAGGAIHLLAAMVGWVLFTISALMLSSRLKRDEYWDPWRPLLIGLSWLSVSLLVALAAVVVSKAPFGGLAEKAFIADRNLWALVIAVLALNSTRVSERDLRFARARVAP